MRPFSYRHFKRNQILVSAKVKTNTDLEYRNKNVVILNLISQIVWSLLTLIFF